MLQTLHSTLSVFINKALVKFSSPDFDKDALWSMCIGIVLGLIVLFVLTSFPSMEKDLSIPHGVAKVYQDDFSPAKGNALQAAVASIFGHSLHDVPNFIEAKEGYEAAIKRFYQQQKLQDGKKGECTKVKLHGVRVDGGTQWSYKIAGGNAVKRIQTPEDEEKIKAIKQRGMERMIGNDVLTEIDLEYFQIELEETKQLKERLHPSGPRPIPDEYNEKICILRGKSPRGDFGHVVVAKHEQDGKFEMLHDPHPSGTFLDESEVYGWCIFFE